MTITKNVWKAAAFLLILCMVSTVMISGTYAKYTSTYAGQDTALVAKWNIVATGGGIGMASGTTAHLNLFNHTYKTNLTASSGGVYIIAPGVGGSFTLQFQNNSDVVAQVQFTTAASGSALTVPISYSLTSPAAVTYSAVGLAGALNTAISNITAGGVTASQTVYWSWPYSTGTAGDTADTAIGVTSAAVNRSTYGLVITASAVQLTPGP